MVRPDQRTASLDELLDQAVTAVNRGDVTAARDLAERALAADEANADAAALLSIDGTDAGELRRLALLFCDLVGSTEMSARHDPEVYRALVRRYMAVCREVLDRYRGRVLHIAGDGVFAVFGLPTPHENDAERAVRAGVDIVHRLEKLSAEVEAAVGERLSARAGIHKGLVYFDPQDDEVYGLAANVAARLHGLADPGTVVISHEVREIVGAQFETEVQPARWVKGVDWPLQSFRVVAELPARPALGRRWIAPLTGRDRELQLLHERWKQVRAEGGTVCVGIVAEPGIGKTRLAAALADEIGAEARGSLQLLGSPMHADANFHAVRMELEARCGRRHDGAPDERLARLERHLAGVRLDSDEMVPLLAPVLDIPASAGYRPVEADSRKLHEAILAGAVRYVLARLGPGPSLMVVDDLHWCDESTLEVLARVLGSGELDLLAVFLSREVLPQTLGDIETISLGPLDDTASARLVLAVDESLDDQACRALVDRGDGVPLYLEELARARSAGADSRRAPPGFLPTSLPVPDALYEPLLARLAATGLGLEVAAAAATVGRDVDRALLAEVVGARPQDFEAAIVGLLSERVLERVPGDEDRYHFRHELVRAVAYTLRPPSQRRRLHRRVAETLIRHAGEAGTADWRLVADHYAAAGRAAEAAAAYRQAADGARQVGAVGEARTLLSQAIALVEDLPDDFRPRSLELELRLRRGFLAAMAEGNSSPEAVLDYERCLELVGLGVPADDALFTTLIPLFGYYMVRGDLGRAEQVAQTLRASLANGRQLHEPDNDAALGMIHWYAGDFAAARARLEVSVAGLSTRAQSPDYGRTYFIPNDAPASAHANLAVARFMDGDLHGADAELDAARWRCRGIGFPQGAYTNAFAESYAAWMLVERGDLQGALHAAAAVTDLADRHGFDLWTLIGATEQAAIAALSAIEASPEDRAALAAHAETVEGLCAAWTLVDVALFLPFFTATAGRLRAASGDPDAAAALYDEAGRFAATTGIHFYDAEVRRLRARLLDGDEARAELQESFELASSQGAAPFQLRTAHDLVAIDAPDAVALLTRAVAAFAPNARYRALDRARSIVASAA